MTNTMDEAIAYAHNHPLRDGGPWHNWCESFIYRAGGFTKSFPTAWAAGLASGPLNRDHAAAPKGAIHYWNQRTASGGPGHVGFSMGNDIILMASNAVVYKWGTDLGTCTFEQYRKAKPDMIYQGWTMRHGNEQLKVPQVVVADTSGKVVLPNTPASLPPRKDDLMAQIVRNSTTGWIGVLGLDLIIHISGKKKDLETALKFYHQTAALELTDSEFVTALYLNLIPTDLHANLTGIRYYNGNRNR